MRHGWLLGLLALSCVRAAPEPVASTALRLRLDGRLPESYAAYAQALCAAPADLLLVRSLAEVWQQLGGAGEPYAAVADCGLSTVAKVYLEALVAAVRGDTRTAIVLLDQVLTDLKGDLRVEVLQRKGMVLLAAGEPVAARAVLAEAVGLLPARADLRLALAQSQLASGQLVEAAALVRGIMTLTPTADEIERGRKLLRIIIARGEPPLAEPVEATLRELLTSLSRGNPSNEEFLRIEALRDEVHHARVLTVAGLAALNRGLGRQALADFEAAAALAPLDAEPWRVWGNGLVALHRDVEALKPLIEAHTRDPFDADTTRTLAQVALRAGEGQLACESYRAVVTLQPGDSEAILSWMRLERQLGHGPAALRIASKALSRFPRDVAVLAEIAVLTIERLQLLKTQSGDEPETTQALGRAVLAALSAAAPQHPLLDGLSTALANF